MNAASTTGATNRFAARPALSQQRTRPMAEDRRETRMPRSTTRVIWTRSNGPSVQYGDIA